MMFFFGIASGNQSVCHEQMQYLMAMLDYQMATRWQPDGNLWMVTAFLRFFLFERFLVVGMELSWTWRLTPSKGLAAAMTSKGGTFTKTL